MVKPLGAFQSDNLKGLSVIIPNVCNDMHNCSISTGDKWLKNQLPAILNHMHSGDFVAVTWDEGSTNQYGGGHVATIFAGPGAKKHFKDGHFYTTDSLLRTVENIFRVPCLRNACNVSGMANMLQ
jgi:phosphatidylinositol-3-phosphatase